MEDSKKNSKAERNYRLKYFVILLIIFISIILVQGAVLNDKIINGEVFVPVGFTLAIIAFVIAIKISAKANDKFSKKNNHSTSSILI